MRIIRAQLEGADAELGRVAAADIAHIILGLQRAIARAAYVVLGRSRRGTGRHSQAIETASRLRLVDIERGSVVGLLALPDLETPEPELPISVPDLSTLALEHVLDAIDEETAPDAELAAAIAGMAADVGIGGRNRSITLVADGDPATRRPDRQATVDAAVRERMHLLSALPPPHRDQALVGVLYEADFEERTARLRLPDGEPVTVSFRPELADQIHQALRSRTWVEGVVRYHPRTSRAVSVELRALGRDSQLPVDTAAFWRSDSFADLQAVQGVTGMVIPADVAIRDLTPAERAAFLADLAE